MSENKVVTGVGMSVRTILPVVWLILARSAVANDLPTPEQLQKLAENHDWPNLLKSTTRVLLLKGQIAQAYDRPTVWQLKAEAQLQQNLFIAASESFERASEEPGIDPRKMARCIALSRVLRKTDVRGFKLPPSRPGENPGWIDLKNPENRLPAIQAFFKAEYQTLQSQLEKQKTDPEFRELQRIAKSANELTPIEQAASDSTEQTQELINQVIQLWAGKVNSWVEKSIKQVDEIRESAEQLQPVEPVPGSEKSRREPTHQKRGLTLQDRDRLKSIRLQCQRIANSYKYLVDILGSTPEELSQIPPKVEQLYATVQKILDDNHSDVSR